jgi:two-component system sensor histidine kinase PilS (NtrC family)
VTSVGVGRPLRLFLWVRLGTAGVVFFLVPLMPADLRPATDYPVVALVLLIVVASSATVLAISPSAPGRMVGLISVLDTVLVTALVAATGGQRSIFIFLYVLTVTGACVLLPRAGALAVAGLAALLYAGLVVGATLLPLAAVLDAPPESSALGVLSVFLNAATLLVVALVASGLAQQYRTTRRELETQQKDLQDLQAFRTVILNSAGTGFIALDQGYRITALNPAAQEITGLRPGDVIGRPWNAVFGTAAPLDTLEQAAGQPRPPVRHETTIGRPDGLAVPVRFTFAALRSSTGGRLGVIVVCEDLSEIRAMESRMRQADRLASLGRLAANIAHEIRNPLASMTGAVEALSASAAPEERERLAQIVARESARLNALIGNFLQYARPAPLVRTRVDVAEILGEVLALLEHRDLPPALKIAREFPPALPWPVDSQQLRQALWNLCLNALDAMPDGGELKVEAAVHDGRLEIAVVDTGEGIPASDLPHVLEPFFSTKPGGSGLGLALVHRIAQDHGGEVSIDSQPGLGTRVTLRLPETAHP